MNKQSSFLQHKKVLVALSTSSRAEVDSMIKKAIAAECKEYRPVEDYGWMYGRSFQDINGMSGNLLTWIWKHCQKK